MLHVFCLTVYVNSSDFSLAFFAIWRPMSKIILFLASYRNIRFGPRNNILCEKHRQERGCSNSSEPHQEVTSQVDRLLEQLNRLADRLGYLMTACLAHETFLKAGRCAPVKMHTLLVSPAHPDSPRSRPIDAVLHSHATPLDVCLVPLQNLD